MGSHRPVIRDSDDEDDDVNLFTSPAKFPVGAHVSDLKTSRETDSTDPSFFRRVYEEQLGDVAAAIPNDLPEDVLNGDATSGVAPQNISEFDAKEAGIPIEEDPSLLTSLTDPPPRQSRVRRDDQRGPSSSSQITSPKRSGSDAVATVWDVPGSTASPGPKHRQAMGSSASGAKKAARTYGKRTKSSQASGPAPEMGSTDDLTLGAEDSPALIGASAADAADFGDDDLRQPPRRKGKKGLSLAGNGGSNMDQTILTAGKDECNASKSTKKNNRLSDEAVDVVPETLIGEGSASLHLAPSALTSSQKREYHVVTSSPAEDQTGKALSLPRYGSARNDLQKSSGSATIAYTTPSNYASSGRKEKPHPAQPSDTRSKRKVANTEWAEEPASSPDIISTSTTKRRKVIAPSAPSSSSLPDTGSTASRRSHSSALETQAAQDPAAGLQVSSDRRGTRSSDANILSTADELGEMSSRHVPDELLENHNVSSANPTKRKRGRPRKSDLIDSKKEATGGLTKPAEFFDDPDGDAKGQPEYRTESDQSSDEDGPKSRKRLKKMANKTSKKKTKGSKEKGNSTGQPSNGPEAITALAELSVESAATRQSSDPHITGETGLPATKDVGKENDSGMVQSAKVEVKEKASALGTSLQLGKVAMRVGLSKKSRIAPLLTIIRK